MLTLNDGRSELWQWDTGRTLAVDADCSQVHFSNKVFGRSIDVDVVDGAAIIPDVLLQTDKDLNVWAFVGTAENGYTKISKTFKVNRRNKPADYVFTQTDQMTLQTIQRQIGDLADLTTEAKDTLVAAINEAAKTGGGGGGDTSDHSKLSNRDAANQHPMSAITGLVGALNGKVSVADIIDNLTTNAANKPLSAAQGVALKALIDAIRIPEKLPNPHALTFTGAVTGSYDGTNPVSVEIPSGGGYTWEETVLASGTLVADTTVDYDTGITLAMLREYKSFVYRLKGASNVVLSNLYLMLGTTFQSIDRADASGRIVVYEWADAAKTVLYMKSGYAANSSMVFIDKNFAFATNQPQGYTAGPYSPIRYIDVSALQETDRLKFYCVNVPKINYAFDIRGLTK